MQSTGQTSMQASSLMQLPAMTYVMGMAGYKAGKPGRVSGNSALDAYVQLQRDAALGRARPARELARMAVAEDHVALERGLRQLLDACLVAVRGVDGVARLLGDRELG